MTQAATSFEYDANGAFPAGFSRPWVTSGTWAVVDGGGFGGSKGLRWTPGSSVRNALKYDPVGTAKDFDIRMRWISTNVTGNQDARSVTRGSGAATSENGYILGQINGFRRAAEYVTGGSLTTVGTDSAFTTVSATWYATRVQCITVPDTGSGESVTLKVKTWADPSGDWSGEPVTGGPDNDGFAVKASDTSTLTAGWAGLFVAITSGTTTFDFFGVGTGTDSAPTTATDLAPTATLAASETTNVEPGRTVTLTLGASDPEGDTTTGTLRQISGLSTAPSGSGSTRTVVAPYTLAGTSLVYGYVVNDGTLDSSEATVTIAVLNATERIVTTGGSTPTEIPLIFSSV